jgi:glutaminyl-peptide cyclotransferase
LADIWKDSPPLSGNKRIETLHPATSRIDEIDLFILLDLLGSPDPIIQNRFNDTKPVFEYIQSIETKLSNSGFLGGSYDPQKPYFRNSGDLYAIEDDHVPFMKFGVPIFHVIPSPFPKCWHKGPGSQHPQDDATCIEPAVLENHARIWRVFLYEYLDLGGLDYFITSGKQ